MSDCIRDIREKYSLRVDWFNFLLQVLMKEEVIVPENILWQQYGPLYIHVPPAEYILALKIAAGRDKDLEDCGILLPQSQITTREQAQQLIEQYLSPVGQTKHAEKIKESLDKLFNEQPNDESG